MNRYIKLYIKHCFYSVFNNNQHIFAPWLFIIGILVMFSMLMGDIQLVQILPIEFNHQFLLSVIIIMTVICVSWFLMHIASSEKYDHGFEQYTLMGITRKTELIAKSLLVMVYTGVSMVIITFFVSILFGLRSNPKILLGLFGCVPGIVFGIVPIGVLCTNLVIKTSFIYLLFPVIYYPLISPSVLSAMQAINRYVDSQLNLWQVSWWWILWGFGLGFFALSYFFVDLIAE